MNELELYLPTGDPAHNGYTKILGGPTYPFHGRFNPGDGIGIGYEDLKCIEAYHFLRSIVEGTQYEPSFLSARRLAEVQAAMMRSWQSGQWENITAIYT